MTKTVNRRWVIKIGSSLLTEDGVGFDVDAIQGWAAQCLVLGQQGIDVVLVSSGAVAAGVTKLGWDTRPTDIHLIQAAAAIGQVNLVQTWQQSFDAAGVLTAQVLLTHQDVVDNERYANARATLNELIALGVVPIVNENDTVAIEELCLGDNDTLGALVAALVGAERLIILTDQAGLYTADPRNNPDATLLSVASLSESAVLEMAGGGAGELGRGGMRTKVLAAARAAESGIETIIAAGAEPNVIVRLAAGEAIGTRLTA